MALSLARHSSRSNANDVSVPSLWGLKTRRWVCICCPGGAGRVCGPPLAVRMVLRRQHKAPLPLAVDVYGGA